MENALTKPVVKPSLTATLAARYNVEPAKFIAVLKATVMPKKQGSDVTFVTDEDLAAFCMVAHEYGLNPFLKEIHAFPNKSGGITAVVGVDGWCSLMNRRPEYDGIEFSFEDDNGKPVSCTAKIHIKGRAHPVAVTEYYSECVRQTDPWRTCPRRMLRHKALIQCARVAFGFSGIHDEDDALAMAVNVTPAEEKVEKPKFKRVEKIIQGDTPANDAKVSYMVSAEDEPVAPAPAPAAAPATDTPQAQLEAIITGAGLNLDDYNRWCIDQQETPMEFPTFGDVPPLIAARHVKAKTGLIRGIAALKGGAQ